MPTKLEEELLALAAVERDRREVDHGKAQEALLPIGPQLLGISTQGNLIGDRLKSLEDGSH
jgi:hypothetical protein